MKDSLLCLENVGNFCGVLRNFCVNTFQSLFCTTVNPRNWGFTFTLITATTIQIIVVWNARSTCVSVCNIWIVKKYPQYTGYKCTLKILAYKLHLRSSGLYLWILACIWTCYYNTNTYSCMYWILSIDIETIVCWDVGHVLYKMGFCEISIGLRFSCEIQDMSTGRANISYDIMHHCILREKKV